MPVTKPDATWLLIRSGLNNPNTIHIKNKIIENVVVRQRYLRWPVSRNLKQKLIKQKILNIERRALETEAEDEFLVPEMGIIFHQVPKDGPVADRDHGFGD